MSRLRASGSPQRRIANAAEFGHLWMSAQNDATDVPEGTQGASK